MVVMGVRRSWETLAISPRLVSSTFCMASAMLLKLRVISYSSSWCFGNGALALKSPAANFLAARAISFMGRIMVRTTRMVAISVSSSTAMVSRIKTRDSLRNSSVVGCAGTHTNTTPQGSDWAFFTTLPIT